MKYLVLSDIHGDRNYLNRVLAEVPDIKNIIFEYYWFTSIIYLVIPAKLKKKVNF